MAKTKLERLLLEGLDSGEAIDISNEWWKKITELVEKVSKQKTLPDEF
ncbi:hypothetical protein [Microcoleus sp. BROC3]